MTNEKALNTFETLLRYGYIPTNEVENKMCIQAICEGIKALTNTNKYRWHDLRKNPDDYPPDNDDVYVKAKMYCEWDKQYRIFVIQMSYKRKIMYGKPIGWSYSYPYTFEFETDEVIAWRYIEPFEVDDD